MGDKLDKVLIRKFSEYKQKAVCLCFFNNQTTSMISDLEVPTLQFDPVHIDVKREPPNETEKDPIGNIPNCVITQNSEFSQI